MSDSAVADAVSKYLALLAGLTAAPAAADGSAAAAASPDEALAAAEGGAAPAAWLAAGSPSKLRYAAQFEWGEALFAPAPGAPPRSSTAQDAVFELASVLVAFAVRLMHAASQACADSASGVAAPASTRGYNLLRQAAGVLELVDREVLPALPAGLSADCERQAVRALASLALADAQQLTMLRAVAKGNQPQLIAGIAADTAELYSTACSQVGSAGGAARQVRSPQAVRAALS